MKKLSILSILMLTTSISLFASAPKEVKIKAELQKASPSIPETVKAAIAKDDAKAVKEFIDEYGNTLAHLAAMHNAGKVNGMLLNEGINEETLNDEGFAPIHIAAQKNLHQMIFDFGLWGANVHLKDKHGKKALDYLPADADETREMLSRLKEYEEDKNPQLELTDEIIKNVESNMWTLRGFLNKHPQNIHVTDKDGNGLLHLFARPHIQFRVGGNALRLLLARKAQVNTINNLGQTPLILAAKHMENGRTACIKLLIDFGADTNITDKYGYTALMYAFKHLWGAWEKDYQAIALLLKAKANPNIVLKDIRWDGYERDWQMPLHFAADKNDLELAQLLLAHNASTDSVDKYGRKPIDYAKSSDAMKQLLTVFEKFLKTKILPKNLEIIVGEFIVDPLPRNKVINDIKAAIRENDMFALIGEISAQKGNIEQADELGYRALHMAVIDCRPEMVQLLLKCRAQKNAQTKYGQTPRDLALAEIVKIEIKKKAIQDKKLKKRLQNKARLYRKILQLLQDATQSINDNMVNGLSLSLDPQENDDVEPPSPL
jgi:ankyrin repeat protein